VGFLLDHLPEGMNLLISTRVDPPLPLARLRARGELVEIRAADLRFTADEARAYLNGVMGLDLGGGEVAALAQRTEGWIAALQLAALSMSGRDDVAAFIEGFAGDDRYIVDYLVEEVLQRQPEKVRLFLMRTCFLERLNGSLCDAVTGASGGAAMLESLVRANLFVVPLDSRREWYRYHHLFADVLQTSFATELRDELPALHRRASDWYAGRGARAEAIQHAIVGADFARAADLIEGAVAAMRQGRQEMKLGAWIAALPDDLVRARPVLTLALVGALISMGKFDGIEARLRHAELLLAAPATSPAFASDPVLLEGLPAAIELYRAALAQVRGDLPEVIAHAQRCVDLAPADDHLVRAGAYGFLGIALWTAGDLESAERAWRECRDGLRRAGHVADIFGTSIALADINQTLGRLRAAARIHDEALALGMEEDGPAPRGTADIHAGLSELHRLSGDLELANQHLMRSQELGELAGLPQFPYRWRIAMAHLREAAGDPEAALDLLEEADRVYVPDFFPNVRPIAARKARVLIREARLAEARRWQREAGVAATDVPIFIREYEHVTLARLLLAEDRARGAAPSTASLELLDRLLEAADRGGRLGSVVEIAALRALALQANGDADAALVALGRALELAAPEGFAAVFLEEGPPMAALLKTAAKRGVVPAYARTLLAAFQPDDGSRAAAPSGDLIEPLSERELDVLRLLRSDLDGPDIARELRVSLNTMRTHTKNIYEKLGVNNRRAAVRRAEELELLRR
jgi:LuxR family maltose regulon positive regulatory protein